MLIPNHDAAHLELLPLSEPANSQLQKDIKQWRRQGSPKVAETTRRNGMEAVTEVGLGPLPS